MNNILLFKDSSIKLCKNIQKNIVKYFDKIKFIMFLADQQNETFILQKPKEFMKSFYKASITFESIIVQNSYINEDVSSYPHILHKISKDILSLSELYSYLHSLNRIRLWNKLSNSNECASFELIEFSYFELTISDKSENILFHKKMDITSELGQFGVNEIMESLKSVYSPIENTNKYITISDYKWKITKKNFNDMDLCGIYLPLTKSIVFLYGKAIYRICQNIKSVYYYTMTYNKNIMSSDECHELVDSFTMPDCGVQSYGAIRFQDLWTHSHEDFIELIVYLSYITSTSIVVSELNDFGELKETYSTISQFQLELFGNSNSIYKGIDCDNSNPITLNSILDMI